MGLQQDLAAAQAAYRAATAEHSRENAAYYAGRNSSNMVAAAARRMDEARVTAENLAARRQAELDAERAAALGR